MNVVFVHVYLPHLGLFNTFINLQTSDHRHKLQQKLRYLVKSGIRIRLNYICTLEKRYQSEIKTFHEFCFGKLEVFTFSAFGAFGASAFHLPQTPS